MKHSQFNQKMLEKFNVRWKTLCICYDTTIEDVQSLREDIESFVTGNDDVPDEFFMLLSDIEDWLVIHMEEEIDNGDESLVLTEDEVYRRIALSAFKKIKTDSQDVDWDEDDEEIWLHEIVNMMMYINKGDSNEIVAYKILNDFLRLGYEVELRELTELVDFLNSSCEQELLAFKIAEMAFELGAAPEIALARAREILS